MRFSKSRSIPVRYLKSKEQHEALDRLNAFLDEHMPEMVLWLSSLWDDQQTAITYRELTDAIVNGSLSPEDLAAWQQDYAVFFNQHIKDILLNSAEAGATDYVSATFGETFFYAPMEQSVERWITAHGAEWVTQVSQESKDAISAMVRYSARGNMTVDELARAIRPTIGLTERQAKANLRYYEYVKEQTKKDLLERNPRIKESTAAKRAQKRAREAAVRYAARQHRQRAQTIAETELAFAYNKGADDAVCGAMREGLLPRMRRKWSTAADERVCEICGALDGMEIEMDDSFSFPCRQLYEGQHETPPAHPRCRCAVCYVEAEE